MFRPTDPHNENILTLYPPNLPGPDVDTFATCSVLKELPGSSENSAALCSDMWSYFMWGAENISAGHAESADDPSLSTATPGILLLRRTIHDEKRIWIMKEIVSYEESELPPHDNPRFAIRRTLPVQCRGFEPAIQDPLASHETFPLQLCRLTKQEWENLKNPVASNLKPASLVEEDDSNYNLKLGRPSSGRRQPAETFEQMIQVPQVWVTYEEGEVVAVEMWNNVPLWDGLRTANE